MYERHGAVPDLSSASQQATPRTVSAGAGPRVYLSRLLSLAQTGREGAADQAHEHGGGLHAAAFLSLALWHARTEEVEKALYLRQWGVPFDALAYVFGRNAMFWYRAWLSLGRPNLVGTTVKNAAQMPLDLVADEKITWLAGEEVVVPTTVGGGCVLGISVAAQATSAGLQDAYGEFKTEATAVFPDVRAALGVHGRVCGDAGRVVPALSAAHLGPLLLARHPQTHRALPRHPAPPGS